MNKERDNGDASEGSEELVWELVRDEWELLLAVGAGPAQASEVAELLGEDVSSVVPRLALLTQHGVVSEGPLGYKMLRVFHRRQEGMASYLRELVLKRLDFGAHEPVAGAVAHGLGNKEGASLLLSHADLKIFPRVIELASEPEAPDSARYSVVLALTSESEHDSEEEGLVHADSPGFSGALLRVVRCAAVQRIEPERAEGAKLWVAEMRTSPAVAAEVGRMLSRFVNDAPKSPGSSSVGFVVMPLSGAECQSDGDA